MSFIRISCVLRFLLLPVALLASACGGEMSQIDPPSLNLQTELGPQPSHFTITNGAGKVLVDNAKADPTTDQVTADPAPSDLDGTLHIRIVRDKGEVVEQTLTHEPGKPVRIVWEPSTGRYKVAVPIAEVSRTVPPAGYHIMSRAAWDAMPDAKKKEMVSEHGKRGLTIVEVGDRGIYATPIPKDGWEQALRDQAASGGGD